MRHLFTKMSGFSNYEDDDMDLPLREGQEILLSEEAEATMIDNFLGDTGEGDEDIAVLEEEIEEEENIYDEEEEVETKRRRPIGEEDEEPSHNTETQDAIAPVAVVKKPLSKWLVYLGEQRKIVSEQNPSLSVAQLTKLVGEQYKVLSDEEHQRLDELVRVQKEKYDEYIRLHPEASTGNRKGGNNNSSSGNRRVESGTELIFPLARVKKTMKCDDEIKTVSKEALVAVTKAVELFIGTLALKSASTTALRGARTIQLNDVLHTIHNNNKFDFLQFDFPKPTSNKPSGSRTTSSAGNHRSSSSSSNFGGKKSSGGVSSSATTVQGKNSIKSFFVGGKRKSDDDEDIGVIANEESEEIPIEEQDDAKVEIADDDEGGEIPVVESLEEDRDNPV